ncbi:lipocalin family protein [Celerinatantimonas yamalensis]|uniref:Outer membrane lipoprotein Blc n=1 Tax=Celerinatantimonas yamalensis TaxID=559956 RepID=A0ABW9G7L5_9GAMM
MIKRWAMAAMFASFLTGCTSLPDGVSPVQNFSSQRYLGKWYEIARLDHHFEKGLTDVTATYSLRNDGGLEVINRGYSPEKERWKQAKGKAYFVKSTDTGYLKVSFFGPFYGTYAVIDLDKNYQYSLVAGPDKSYLWILSRTPTLPQAIQQRLINKAKSLGFDTSKLVMVNQQRNQQ